MQVKCLENNVNGVLETIEALPIEDQIVLLEVMQNRLVDSRRTEIAANILKAYFWGWICG